MLRILQFMKIAATSEKTFYNHQSAILQPAIKRQFKQHMRDLVKNLKMRGKPLTTGGDERADSPGHSAKYGAYSTIDLESNKIIDIQLVQMCNA